MKNKNMPIYPQSQDWQKDMEMYKAKPERYGSPSLEGIGLTKREYFAAMAMQGLLSNHMMIDTTNYEWIAEHSIGYADALLEAL